MSDRDDLLVDPICERSPDTIHCQHWFEDAECCWCSDQACDLEDDDD